MGLSLGGASGLSQRPLEMSLYRRGRIWWIKLSSERGPVRESSGAADKKAAWEYHEKRKGEIWRQERLGEKPPVTWGEAVAKWLNAKPRGLPDRYRISRFAVGLTQAIPLSEDVITKLLKSNSTAGSWNRSLALVLAIHNASGVEPPKVQRRPMPPGRTRWLTAEEWQRLRTALGAESPLLQAAAEFTLATGLRENNVLNLEWEQVSIRNRQIWLHGDQMKAGRPHGIPLNDAACAILEARSGIHKRWVFGNPDYPLYKASNRAWYNALRRARLYKRVPGSKRLEVCWHTLRHTWASWAAMSGVGESELMALGHWKTHSMVRRYAHLSVGHLAKAAASVKPVSLSYNVPKKVTAEANKGTKGR